MYPNCKTQTNAVLCVYEVQCTTTTKLSYLISSTLINISGHLTLIIQTHVVQQNVNLNLGFVAPLSSIFKDIST